MYHITSNLPTIHVEEKKYAPQANPARPKIGCVTKMSTDRIKWARK